jgi:DNA-binding CsgD family transcriptional regulator
MECDRERDFVRAEAARVIRACLRLPALRGVPTGGHRINSEIQTATARYRIAATFLEDHSSDGSLKAIALIDKIERKPMDGRELVARFSFTRREIEAAQLLRNGLSSRQIAAALGISVNTARRHVERVLLKLDVHTRPAAVAKLSGL